MNVSDVSSEKVSFHNAIELDLTQAQVLEAISFLNPLIRSDFQPSLMGQQAGPDQQYLMGGVEVTLKAAKSYTIDLEHFAPVNRRNVVQIMDMKFDLIVSLEKLKLMNSDFRFEDKIYKLVIDSKQNVFLIIENRLEEERKEDLLKIKRKEELQLERRLKKNKIEDLLLTLGRVA